MLAQCFSFFFFLNTLFIPEFSLPFSESSDSVKIFNLSCSNITVGEVNTTFTDSIKSVEVIKPITASCSVNVSTLWGLIHFMTLFDAKLDTHSAIEFSTETGEGELTCQTTAANTSYCNTALLISNLSFVPGHAYDWVKSLLQTLLNSFIKVKICSELSTKVKPFLLNHTVEPPSPPPDVVPGALALRDTELFRAARNIALTIKNVLNISFGIDLLDDPYNSTLRVNVTNTMDRNITVRLVGSETEGGGGAPASGALRLDLTRVKTVDDLVKLAHQLLSEPEVFVEKNLSLAAAGIVLGDASVQVILPAGMSFSVEVTLNDLRCEPETYNYNVRAADGFSVGNVRLVNAGDLGPLFTNFVGPLVSGVLNDRINGIVSMGSASTLEDGGVHGVLASVHDSAGGDSKRVYIPMRSKAAVTLHPPRLLVVLYVVGSAVVTVCLVCLNVMRHRAKPVVDRDTLEAVSVFRVILEDLLLSICCFACAGAFLWSNLTTAAYVSVGGELKIYGFTLMGTVRDLWDAGLKPLSVLVFVFSGIYPYFKLSSMLLFTLVLQRPHARILLVIDYVGKFSFLDIFVTFITIIGMPIPGIADVVVLSSFYVFFGATIASVLLGNYTVLLWRHGTTLTRCSEDGLVPHDGGVPEGSQGDISNPPCAEDDVQPSSGSPVTAYDNLPFAKSESLEVGKTTARERWYVNTILFCIMLGCLLPAWFLPCLRYRVGGVAPLITAEYKEFNLHQLSNTVSPACFVISLFILLIAPCGYALSRAWFTFLASWFAVDVFLLACVGGLLQLNQFVQFMLGPNMEGVYTAHATPLWPLVLLLIASVLQWALVAYELCHEGIRRCWTRIRGASESS